MGQDDPPLGTKMYGQGFADVGAGVMRVSAGNPIATMPTTLSSNFRNVVTISPFTYFGETSDVAKESLTASWETIAIVAKSEREHCVPLGVRP